MLPLAELERKSWTGQAKIEHQNLLFYLVFLSFICLSFFSFENQTAICKQRPTVRVIGFLAFKVVGSLASKVP
jgi:hypothetical protein